MDNSKAATSLQHAVRKQQYSPICCFMYLHNCEMASGFILGMRNWEKIKRQVFFRFIFLTNEKFSGFKVMSQQYLLGSF